MSRPNPLNEFADEDIVGAVRNLRGNLQRHPTLADLVRWLGASGTAAVKTRIGRMCRKGGPLVLVRNRSAKRGVRCYVQVAEDEAVSIPRMLHLRQVHQSLVNAEEILRTMVGGA